jgi:hypothetical protein
MPICLSMEKLAESVPLLSADTFASVHDAPGGHALFASGTVKQYCTVVLSIGRAVVLSAVHFTVQMYPPAVCVLTPALFTFALFGTA